MVCENDYGGIMFDRIKDLREYEDYSMSQVAKKLNVSKSTYSMWEYGRDVIPIKRLVNLANVYHVKIDYLMNLTDNRKNTDLYSEIDNKVVANNLCKLRENLNLTQDKIAKMIHISRSTWESYEQGRVLITTIPLYELCKKYSLSVEYILFHK